MFNLVLFYYERHACTIILNNYFSSTGEASIKNFVTFFGYVGLILEDVTQWNLWSLSHLLLLFIRRGEKLKTFYFFSDVITRFGKFIKIWLLVVHWGAASMATQGLNQDNVTLRIDLR